jgi:predicted metal-binding membrane protein
VRSTSTGPLNSLLRDVSARPALVAELAIGAAWAAELGSFFQSLRPSASSTAVWWCTAGGAMPSGVARTSGAAPTLGAASASALMCVATMTPAALPAVRHVAANSLRWRRRRATLEFLAVYLAMWTVCATTTLSALALVRPGGALSLPLALALASAWQLTSLKRRALSACHRSSPLPLRGWRAIAGDGRFALRHGRGCVGSCWALMLVMAVAMSIEPLVLPALTALIYCERRSIRPRWATRRVALVLALAAAAATIVAILG